MLFPHSPSTMYKQKRLKNELRQCGIVVIYVHTLDPGYLLAVVILGKSLDLSVPQYPHL